MGILVFIWDSPLLVRLFGFFPFFFSVGWLAMSLWQEQQTIGSGSGRGRGWPPPKERNEINFWFLFIIFSCFLAAPLTHEISGRIEAQRIYEKIYVFTTKTIMDPLIGFLDCVLVSSYFFRTPDPTKIRISCALPMPVYGRMFDDSDLQMNVFSGFRYSHSFA